MPSPNDYRRIGLAATASLRQGPTSPLARLLRELTPYLMEHKPDLYVLEGSYRTILTCGLLRKYPHQHLHCLAPGRLGGLVDLGARVVGQPVAGLDAALGGAGDEVARSLDLNVELDCVIYLIDPLAATSAMPETLALKRECVVAEKPFFDTYGTAAEWFSLLGYLAGGESRPDWFVSDRDLDALGCPAFPHGVIALVAHDAKKQDMVDFAREHREFLGRFDECLGTGRTAARLTVTRSRVIGWLWRLASTDEEPRVTPLKPGGEGGGLQIGESLAMGLCDALLSFEDPRPQHEEAIGAQRYERAARIANLPDRLGGPSDVVCLHEKRSATAWAQLWEHVLDRMRPGAPPTTVTAAFRRLFDVDLVLAEPRAGVEPWQAIAEEAAWYLVSAIAAKPAYARHPGEPKRVTVSNGAAIGDVIAKTGSGWITAGSPRDEGGEGDRDVTVGGALLGGIGDHNLRHDEAVRESKAAAGEEHARRIDLIARRKELTLRPVPEIAALWSIGAVVVAPMVARFQPTEETDAPSVPDEVIREASENAARLAENIGGKQLDLPASLEAFIAGTTPIPDELDRHWSSTDIVLTGCADLAPHWFATSGKVELLPGMYDYLRARNAVGEIAGLYLTADGEIVQDDTFRRRGMDEMQLEPVARGRDGRAAILVVGAHRTADGEAPARARTVLAALRAGIVSVFITDLAYAKAVLHEYARQRTP